MFINWKATPIGLIGLLILLGTLKFISWMPIGDTLKCVRTNQTCYFNHVYLWPNNNIEAFKFSEVVDIYPELRGIARGSKFYGLRINLERQISIESSTPKSYVIRSSIMVDRPSSYIANKEAIKLKTYLANPQIKELILNPDIRFPIVYFITIISITGFFLLALPFRKPVPTT